MKKFLTVMVCALMICAFSSPLLYGIKSASAETPVLRIANWGEYMAGDKAEGTPELLEQFEEEFGVRVEYSHYDTNEWIYNDMKLNEKDGKYNYDLICPSDYMIQKMIRKNMLEKIEPDKIPSYYENVSPFINELFEKAEIHEYAIGYMWGTLGFVYNADKVKPSDTKSWTVLWNIDYKGKSTLKDSIRDTYFMGLAYVHRDELNALADEYERKTAETEALRLAYQNGDAALKSALQEQLDTAESDYTEFLNDYSQRLDELLNDTTPETVEAVEKALTAVSENIFGYEVDTGKADMITGKIDINFAWSGDAAYIIEEGLESFFYSIPREGSNIWFDGWVMPKGANKELAYKFMEFISRPENAIANMEEIGYTSVIAGANNEIYDWMVEYYELSETGFDDAMRADLTYFFTGSDDEEKLYVYYDKEMYGKAFSAQYPDVTVINRCVVMRDFDDDSLSLISDMWVRLRANKLPLALIIIIAAVIAVAAAAVVIILKFRGKGGKAKKGWTVVKTE
jgi:spermidine/putrescine transport system substrate-binding protein